MARREYVSFLGERRRDISFTKRGSDPGRWVLVAVAIATIAISVWWFGFRETDRVVASERVLNDTTIPTLLMPSALEGSGVDEVEVSLDCPTLVEEWTMFQGGIERTGCLNTLPITEPRILWTTEIGITGWRNNPVIEDGAIFVGSAGVLQFTRDRRDAIYSLDLRTGTQRWRYGTELDVNSVAVSDGIVIAVGDEGRIWGLRARDGELLWEDDLGVGVFGDPIFLDGTVIVGDGNGLVSAYEAETGEPARAWGGRQPRLNGPIRGGASSDGELIYVASEFGEVMALTLEGQVEWEATLIPRDGDSLARVFAAPTVTDTMIILSVIRGDVFGEPGLRALDKFTGDEVWASEDKAGIKPTWANIRSSPAVAGDYLVFGEGYSDEVIVADLNTGETLWSLNAGSYCFPHWPSSVINNGVVYLARHDGGLYAIDLQSREEAWRIYLGNADGNGTFPADHTESDFCQWGPTTGNSILGSPAVASNGVVVIGTLEGYIMAIGDANWET